MRCGNGFTTAFVNRKEKEIRCLILPNREAVLNKEQQYKDAGMERFLSLHGTSDQVPQDSSDIDLILCVYDSFIVWQHRFVEWLERGVKTSILIDEHHALIIGAGYRENLKGNDDRMLAFAKLGAAVCMVTATPFVYDEMDITITNAYNPPTTLYLSESEQQTIARALAAYKAGHNVAIYTNDKTIALQFKDRDGFLRAHIGAGDALALSLAENAEVIHTHNGRLRIYSARGFEGHDIYGEGWHVYIFEHRGKVHTGFTMQQIIQAAARTRAGAAYIEYCRINRKTPRGIVTTEQIRAFIERDDITEEKKLNKDNFAPFKPYITPLFTDTYKMDLRFDKDVYLVALEAMDADKNWLKFYAQYLADRNIEIIPLHDAGYDFNPTRMRGNDKAKYMDRSSEFINTNGLLTGYKVNPFKAGEGFVGHCRRFQDERRRLTFRTETTPEQLKRLACVARYFPPEGDHTYFDKQIKKMETAYNAEIKAGIYTDAEMIDKVDKFKDRVTPDALSLLYYICNDTMNVPAKMVAHRDYNATVNLRPSSMRILFDGFGFTITEADIKTCYPRILYALFAGLRLPDDFYGPNKVNKRKINILLNDTFPDVNSATPIKQQKQNHINRLLKMNIAPAVVDAVVNFCYAGKDRGELFNLMAYHERLIIKQVQDEIRARGIAQFGIPRRHDSVLIFHNDPIDLSWLKDFKYLGVDGWF